MAIRSENTTVSVEFPYFDEYAQKTFKIKLHNTLTYGQTISISGDVGSFTQGNDVYLAIPAKLMTDVVEYLSENRYIKVNKPDVKNSPSNKPKLNREVNIKNDSYLPVPSLGEDSSEIHVDLDNSNEEEDSEPTVLQSFTSEDEEMEDDYIDEDEDEDDDDDEDNNYETEDNDDEKDNGELEIPEVNFSEQYKEDLKAMNNERSDAKNKKTAEKQIKKRGPSIKEKISDRGAISIGSDDDYMEV